MKMKRRQFGLMSASGAAALATGFAMPRRAYAGPSADQVASLQTTLTPWGATRAGNADGSYPAWSGGMTSAPAGFDVTPNMGIMPDFFGGDPKVVTINSSNMAQYQDKLADGVMAMMTKYGFHIDVFPTHRTDALPQFVYDAIATNATTAQLDPRGGRFGFTNAYGGVPFPIPDSDPDVAGAQIIWNHLCRYEGLGQTTNYASYVVSGGQLTLASGFLEKQDSPFYFKGVNASNFDGWIRRTLIAYKAPATLNGQGDIDIASINQLTKPQEAWEYLNGQGRVRKAPELAYDTPASASTGISTYQEYTGFYGATNRYNWKLLGRKEMYMPANCNKLATATPEQAHGSNFINPDFVRWELRRVWVVDATLAPGERNQLPHRRFYMDEDSWSILHADSWDASGNLWKVGNSFRVARPDVGGTITGNYVDYNIQGDRYVTQLGAWNVSPYNGPRVANDGFSDATFSPQVLAAQAQY